MSMPVKQESLDDLSFRREVKVEVNSLEIDPYAVKAETTADISISLTDNSNRDSYVKDESGSKPSVGFNAPERDRIRLSPEQRRVLDMVKDGKNVFFTGSAGTGKSLLLRKIIHYFDVVRKRYSWDDGSVAITASTGIAAVNIGGCTLHSWAGIGISQKSADDLLSKLYTSSKKRSKKARNQHPKPPMTAIERWQSTRVLIIDEISMIDGKLFDKLEYIARKVRHQLNLPFGGIQLVLSGDFLQLPPVPDRLEGVQVPSTFAFDAESWKRCIDRTVFLKKVFRQREQTFIDILNAMRFGKMSDVAVQRLRHLSRNVYYGDGIQPTDLYPTKLEVERRNHACLNAMKSTTYEYRASDVAGLDHYGQVPSQDRLERILDQLIAPTTVTLKIGAQVMLIKNVSQGKLVNGSIGRVVEFVSAFEAETRGITLSLTENHRADRGEWEKDDSEISRRKREVRIPTPNGARMLIVPDVFDVYNANGRIEAQRTQIPLILAWALSIHKSQGQTLERVRVDLRRTFECGQAYVALSRAKTMEGLQILNFDPMKVRAHPRVMEWMREQENRRINDEIDDDLEFWSEDIDLVD